MGRHSLDPEHGAPPERKTIAPVTDPLLLVAVEQELQRLRDEDTAAPAAAGPTRRVETPFSGPVDVPVENAVGPDLPVPLHLSDLTPPTVARQARAAPSASSRSFQVPAPAPVSARAAAAAPIPPTVVPTHRPSPVPVEPQQEQATPQEQAPVGLSLRTLLVSGGIGLFAVTALSLIALIPR